MTTSNSNNFATIILMCMALLTLSVPAMAIDDRPAPGPPETMLGGISHQKTSLNEIIRMYGPPTQEPGTYGANGDITFSPGRKEDGYIWIKSCVVLYVCCLNDDTWDLTTINVFPNHSNCTAEDFAKGGPIAQTGFGLRLGDDKAAWNRIYGKQLGGVQPDHGSVLDNFQNGKQLGYGAGGFWRERDKSCDGRSSKGEHMPCFRKTRLGAKFDAAGKINFMMMEHFANTYLPGSEYAPAWLPGDAPPTSSVSSKETTAPQSDVIAVDKVTSTPQMGAVSQAPTGASQSSPPAGYYQCYRLTVAISANSCKLGDLQLDGQGSYSSTGGPGGTYVFDPAAGVVSFSDGMLNGRMARTKISNKGTYMLRMRPDGNGLPSPKQTFGTYTFEHKSSGHRER